MTVYVVSKMANAVSYNFYERHNTSNNRNDATGDLPMIKHKVVIKGGAGIPSLDSGLGERTKTPDGMILYTADGIVTPISDSDYEMLKDHHVFKQHVAGGLLEVVRNDITDNNKAIRKVAATMNEDPFGLMTAEKLKSRVKVTSRRMDEEENRL